MGLVCSFESRYTAPCRSDCSCYQPSYPTIINILLLVYEGKEIFFKHMTLTRDRKRDIEIAFLIWKNVSYSVVMKNTGLSISCIKIVSNCKRERPQVVTFSWCCHLIADFIHINYFFKTKLSNGYLITNYRLVNIKRHWAKVVSKY